MIRFCRTAGVSDVSSVLTPEAIIFSNTNLTQPQSPKSAGSNRRMYSSRQGTPAKELLPKPTERPVSYHSPPGSAAVKFPLPPPSPSPARVQPSPTHTYSASSSPVRHSTVYDTQSPSPSFTPRKSMSQENRIIPPPGVPSPYRADSPLYHSSPVPQPTTVPPTAVAVPHEELVYIEEEPAPRVVYDYGMSHSGRHWTDSGRTLDIVEEEVEVVCDRNSRHHVHYHRNAPDSHVRWSERDRELYERYRDVCHEAHA
eukprot:TRINITY_DN2711_c0_g1_i2.p1 TRINITY_DN2711_c0_g1~~TRINITY_DN2711_c0_g1_i2.p1  ORF type:complete len:256 (+),score=14.81 TRINITY_DN2711_c0_g1_i2:359-1126(+)